MRILILTQYYPPETGAPQNRLSSLAGYLASYGNAVEILTAMPSYPKSEIFEGYKDKGVFQVKVSFIESLTKLKFHPAIDPYKDSRSAKEIVEKVQLAKKDIAEEDAEPGYRLEGLIM